MDDSLLCVSLRFQNEDCIVTAFHLPQRLVCRADVISSTLQWILRHRGYLYGDGVGQCIRIDSNCPNFPTLSNKMAVLISMTTQSPPRSPANSIVSPSSPRLNRRPGLAHILDPTNGSRRPTDSRRNAMPHIWFDLDASISGRIARRLRSDEQKEESDEEAEKNGPSFHDAGVKVESSSSGEESSNWLGLDRVCPSRLVVSWFFSPEKWLLFSMKWGEERISCTEVSACVHPMPLFAFTHFVCIYSLLSVAICTVCRCVKHFFILISQNDAILSCCHCECSIRAVFYIFYNKSKWYKKILLTFLWRFCSFDWTGSCLITAEFSFHFAYYPIKHSWILKVIYL